MRLVIKDYALYCSTVRYKSPKDLEAVRLREVDFGMGQKLTYMSGVMIQNSSGSVSSVIRWLYIEAHVYWGSSVEKKGG